MNDERWRDSYDSWLQREPMDEVRQCEQCGGWLTHSRRWGWTCEECSPRDVEAERDALEELHRAAQEEHWRLEHEEDEA